ncbi:histone-fold-containing protein [Dendryphion nanum]|uniref:Histone H4 n=1 Tax=Dendryphion nanum TaxID=256645 RepID=A0A9P9IE14_9PLEO|nr:histone-fold-containing protein [Dendryphion nanum]
MPPNERARPFVSTQRYRPTQLSQTPQGSGNAASPAASRATQLGLGLGGKSLGLGLGKTLKRHKKIPRDSIRAVTKGDIRRLARRGGVKRLSATIYDDIRQALKDCLETILRDCVTLVEHSGRKTVTVTDVVFTLNRRGRTIYGFDPSFNGARR